MGERSGSPRPILTGMQPARLPTYSYAEYLAVDEQSNVRLEYADGRIYAMVGGTPEHAARIVNVASALHGQVRGGGCRVYSSDLRVRVEATGLASYPDVVVVCGELRRDPDNDNTALNPTLLVEVLSPSTAEYDRGDKLDHYKRIPSLRQVVLVDHDSRLVELWTRGESSDAWTRTEHREGRVTLAVDAALDLDDVYFEATPPPG